MSPLVFRLVSAAFWIGFGVVVYSSWGAIRAPFETGFPDNTDAMAGFVVALIAGGLFLANALLADKIAPPVLEAKGLMTPAEARAQKLKDAEKAIAEGRDRLAINIFEELGLMMRALEVAQKINDKAALARISLKLGKHGRARKYYLELGEFEAAANMSMLAGEPEKARELYLEAANAAERDDKKPAGADVLARLYDRARQRSRAAELFEAAGDPRSASECYDLSGNAPKAKAMAEQAEMLDLYERKKAGGKLDAAGKRAAAFQTAELLEGLGDILGAGHAFREAEEWQRAATCYEKADEWIRAARCYEKLNKPDRARDMMAREGGMSASRVDVRMLEGDVPIPAPAAQPAPPAAPSQRQFAPPPAPTAAPPAPSGPPPAPPPPSTLAAPSFVPATAQIQYVPIYVMGPPPAASAGSATAQVAALAGQQQFARAAEAALRSYDFATAAQMYQQGGEFVQAADVLRQIGRYEQAAEALGRGQMPVEAAMLSIAIGRRDRAETVLREGIGARKDPELVCLLGELMIERGEVDQAVALLEEKFGAEGVSPATAAIYYRFGRLLEKNGALPQALGVYERMIESGAMSEDLSSRVRKIQEKLGIAQSGPRTASDFLRAFVDDTDSRPRPAESAGPAESKRQIKPYPFSPPSVVSRYETIPVPRPAGDTSAMDPLRQVSLFGGPTEVRSQAPGGAAGAAPRPAPAPVRSPFAPINRYEIKRELGRGGMGAVYEAMDTILARPVALKLIGNQDASPEDLEQFLMEARAIARLAHANVVQVYDVGLIDLRHYIAMEYIQGNDLRTEVHAAKRLPLKDALRYAVEIARGLQAAHEAGIIHRDIKPANVLLTEKKQVKIVDFGLAKLARDKNPTDDANTVFQVAGTPGYMAPEQFTGGDISPACDVYAFGITFYAMLAGEPPHRIAGAKLQHEIFDFQVRGEFKPLRQLRPDVPAAVEQIIAYCCSVTPDGRYRSFDAFLPILEQWMAAI